MKSFFDLQNEEEFVAWVEELRALVKIPTPWPDVTATYRNMMRDWEHMETWQREELTEYYEEHLATLASDSEKYCRLHFTVEELRNLAADALYEFDSYVVVHVPHIVLQQRNLEHGQTDADVEKGAAKLRKILNEALERYRTLEKIDKLGQ